MRKRVLRRDGYTCRRCGRRDGLEVHQRRRMADGGLDEPANLVTLCRPCHRAEHNKGTGRRPDFLVASLTPTPSLSVVRHGAVARCDEEAWVGDSSDAYAAFRQAFTAFDAPSEHPDEATVSRMADAIRAVIEDSRFESVGDLPLAVGVEEDGFRYFTSALMVAGREQSIPSHRWTTVQFGGAAEGGSLTRFALPCAQG